MPGDFPLAMGRFPHRLLALMNRSGKFHALLATARIANIPSVASNVWLGIAVGVVFCDLQIPKIPWGLTAQLIAAGILLYVAGNFFNDWIDRSWDAKHRPERALPRGLFTPLQYAWLAGIGGALGLALALSVNYPCAVIAGALITCIIIYTIAHKRSSWAVIPMGLCRGLLPIMGFAGTGAGFEGKIQAPLMIATSILCYISGLSLSARYESMQSPPRGASLASRALFGFAAAWMLAASEPFARPAGFSFAGIIPYFIWLGICLTLRRKPIPVHVSSLLAGIPLLDWILLLPLSLLLGLDPSRGYEPFAIACFALPPLAFMAALFLQRLAPAT